jgi:Mg-chelatase subunit ChlD
VENKEDKVDDSTKSKLDLVFLCDCTGSMGAYITSAQASITDIIVKIQASDKTDVRIAVIGYQDHSVGTTEFH